jgi:hypothetical protein
MTSPHGHVCDAADLAQLDQIIAPWATILDADRQILARGDLICQIGASREMAGALIETYDAPSMASMLVVAMRRLNQLTPPMPEVPNDPTS